MPDEKELLKRLQLRVARASFCYGFEYATAAVCTLLARSHTVACHHRYVGVGERLVQTPLTDRCYLTLTQALHFRMGGSPFGPAGTGKTESVKALGSRMGRFVLVFNCDENFDFQAMGRLFVGLCQVGAWGCFDEFNRLEERILSAVSQQILCIQAGLQAQASTLELLNKTVKVRSLACLGEESWLIVVGTVRVAAEPQCRRVHHHEPGLRRPIAAAGQPEAALPQHRHDQTGLGPHRAGDAVLAGLPHRRTAGWQGRAPLLPVLGPVVVAATLRLRLACPQVRAGQCGQPEAPQHGAARCLGGRTRRCQRGSRGSSRW